MNYLKEIELRIETGIAYEFILSLCAWSDLRNREVYEVEADWFKAIEKKIQPELLSSIETFSGNSYKVWAHLLGVAYDCPKKNKVSDFLDYLQTVSALEIKRCLAGYYMRYFRRKTSPQTILDAVGGDLAAQKEFLRTSYPEDSEWQLALRYLLPLSAENVKRELLELLTAWYEQVFNAQEAQLLPLIELDAQSKRVLLNLKSPSEIIELVTNGWQYAPEPGVTNIVLIPSVISRPFLHNVDQNETKFFSYPVAPENLVLDAEEPSPYLVKLLKALADERRLRVLRRLATGEYTLQELTEHFEMGKTLMHHHLVILRSAGLIYLRGGSTKRYSLKPSALAELQRLLGVYLPEKSLAPPGGQIITSQPK
jgi:DNA-binding transcriptional ArsR family regulator